MTTQRTRIISQIKESFDYLFEEYGFRFQSQTHFASFGNWVVLLQSPDCRLRFFQDRGEVLFAFGPHWSPPSWQAGPWFQLSVLLEFVTGEQPQFECVSAVRTQQFRQWAHALRPHCRVICALFTSPTFGQVRVELERLQEEHIFTRLACDGDAPRKDR